MLTDDDLEMLSAIVGSDEARARAVIDAVAGQVGFAHTVLGRGDADSRAPKPLSDNQWYALSESDVWLDGMDKLVDASSFIDHALADSGCLTIGDCACGCEGDDDLWCDSDRNHSCPGHDHLCHEDNWCCETCLDRPADAQAA